MSDTTIPVVAMAVAFNIVNGTLVGTELFHGNAKCVAQKCMGTHIEVGSTIVRGYVHTLKCVAQSATSKVQALDPSFQRHHPVFKKLMVHPGFIRMPST